MGINLTKLLLGDWILIHENIQTFKVKTNGSEKIKFNTFHRLPLLHKKVSCTKFRIWLVTWLQYAKVCNVGGGALGFNPQLFRNPRK